MTDNRRRRTFSLRLRRFVIWLSQEIVGPRGSHGFDACGASFREYMAFRGDGKWPVFALKNFDKFVHNLLV